MQWSIKHNEILTSPYASSLAVFPNSVDWCIEYNILY